MKIVRRILAITLIIILLIVSAGFLLPKKVFVERSILIKAPRYLVFDEINTIRNWKKWSPWQKSDPTLRDFYSGPESGQDACLSWRSKNPDIGNGSIMILRCYPFDSLQFIMDFSEYGKSVGNFVLNKQNGATYIKWKMESDLGNNPVSRWFGLFIDKLVGPDFESGLINLKTLIEKTQLSSRIAVNEIILPDHFLLTIKDTSKPETFEIKLSKIYSHLTSVIKSKKLTCIGSPRTLFYTVSDSLFAFEAGIPVSGKILPPEGLNCVEVPGNKYIMTKYFGSSQHTVSAYTTLSNFVKENNYVITGPAWEEYVTDPSVEPDSSKWQTNIYIPVK